jgi:arylsulfatase A-like enzyme
MKAKPDCSKLNIVFILADDMGHWAMGCAGNTEVATPNLDRLAAKGMVFDNAFCVSPVCSPARASLLTGRIPSQHGVHDWIKRGNSAGESKDGAVIDYLEGQPCYTETLAAQGYECALSGKWHLGDAPRMQKGHHFWETHARGGGAYYGAPMIHEGEEYTEANYVTDVITDHALEFLANRQDAAAPFYLAVHYTAPHSPWGREQHPAEYYDAYYDGCAFKSVPDLPKHPWQIGTAPCGDTPEKRREYLSGYYAAVTAMDANIGRLLDALETQGQAENTLIVFTSDNGMNMGHHGIYGKGNGTYPMNMFDTSVKVPFILSCPRKVPAGVRSDALFSHYDFMPSLLGLLGFEKDLPEGLPGQDLSHLWMDTEGDARGNVVVFDEYGPVRMIRDARYKYVKRFTDGPDEFFDLETDPNEQTNLIEESEYQELISGYTKQLSAWFRTHVDETKDGSLCAVTGLGQLDQCQHEPAFEPIPTKNE